MDNTNGAKPLDLVGTHEAALILGVEKPRIGRYIKSGRMPKPVCELGATKLWHRADVEAVARGERPRRAQQLALVGTKEAADLLGVERTRIGRWKQKGIMPDPVSVTKATPVWRKKDVLKLAKRVQRERVERAKQRQSLAVS